MAPLLGHFPEKSMLGSPSSAPVDLLVENVFEASPPPAWLGLRTPRQPEQSHPCFASFANPPLNLASEWKQLLPAVPKQARLRLSLSLRLIQTVERKPDIFNRSICWFEGCCSGQITHLLEMIVELQPLGSLDEKSLPCQACPGSKLGSPLVPCSALRGLPLLAQSLLFVICLWIRS